MSTHKKTAGKYFSQYAEPDALVVLDLFKTLRLKKYYQYVICIPAFDESDLAVKTLIDSFKQQSVLIILIINTPSFVDKTKKKDNDIAIEHVNNEKNLATQQIGDIDLAIQRTHSLAHSMSQYYPIIGESSHISLHMLHDQIDRSCKNQIQAKENHLLIIRRLDEKSIPYKQGVGLARKISNDCAAALINEKYIKNIIIYNTDADAILPKDYFSRIIEQTDTGNTIEKTAAWVYPFQHVHHSYQGKQSASELYQKSIESYVEGLKYAESDFAFHTIGSAIAINSHAYISVRGFPKKNAGEDFYLLNKLRKVGSVETLLGYPIQLSSRISHRVPFGTGPALKKISSSKKINEIEIFYSHECFAILKSFLLFWRSVYTLPNDLQRSSTITSAINKLHIPVEPILSNYQFERLLREESDSLSLFEKLHNTHSQTQWEKKLMQIFDGFRTLKLLHKLRDRHFPLESFNQYIEKPSINI